MKLADESILMEESIAFKDEAEENTEHSYGDLIALIDLKRRRIKLHRSEFQGTINAMKKNTRLAGAGVCITAASIILLIFLYNFTKPSGIFGMDFRICTIIGTFCLIYAEIFNIIKFMIHIKGFFMRYASDHKILPACKATAYCVKVVSYLNACEQNIDNIESTAKNTTSKADISDLYNRLSAIDVEPKTVYEVVL